MLLYDFISDKQQLAQHQGGFELELDSRYETIA